MAETGILAPDARVELIEGEIIDMAPIGSRHASIVDKLYHLLHTAVGTSAIVRSQNPVRLNDISEPEPDLALLRWRDDFYGARHPGPADVLLIVEIADSSLDYDRSKKLPLYASHGIPEVWLVDLTASCVVRYAGPTSSGYATSTPLSGAVAPVMLSGCTVDLGALF